MLLCTPILWSNARAKGPVSTIPGMHRLIPQRQIYDCLTLRKYILWVCVLRSVSLARQSASMLRTRSLSVSVFSAGLPACLSVHRSHNCFYKCRECCSIALQPNRLTRLFSYSREVEWRRSPAPPINSTVSPGAQTKTQTTLPDPSSPLVPGKAVMIKKKNLIIYQVLLE